MPGLYRILVVTVLKWQNAPLLNKKDTANGTALATIRYTPGHFFFDFNVTVVFSNRLTL